MTTPPSSRLLTDKYDYNSLLDYMDWGADEARKNYLGLMRLDSVLFDTLVFTDAQFIQSRFFLDTALSNGLNDLPLRSIELRCRAKNVEQSILAFMIDHDASRLRPQLFTAIENSELIQGELPRVNSKEVRSWRSVPNILVQCGASKDDAERIEEAWAKLIEISSVLRICPWTPIEWTRSFEEIWDAETDWFFAGLELDFSRQIFQQARGLRRAKSVGKLRSLARDRALSEQALHELRAIDAFYSLCYYKNLSFQHDCGATELSDAAFGGKSLLALTNAEADTFPFSEAKVPLWVVQALGEMGERSFEYVASEPRANIRDWQSKPDDLSALQRGVDALLSSVDSSYGRPRLAPAIQNIVPFAKLVVDTSVLAALAAIVFEAQEFVVPAVTSAVAANATGSGWKRLVDRKPEAKIALLDRATGLRSSQ